MKRQNQTLNTAIEWAATALTLIALTLLSEGQSRGFFIGVLSNIAWIYWGSKKRAGGIIAVNAIMIFINLNGLGII